MSNLSYTYTGILAGTGWYQYETPIVYVDGVKTMQANLKTCGYTIDVDGKFSPDCEAIVRKFQGDYGLSIDGKAGSGTLNKLESVLKTMGGGTSGAVNRTMGSINNGWINNGADVKALQEALNKNGANLGTPDGKFGPGTENAVKAFQARKGLLSDGIAGHKTLAALGIYGGGVSNAAKWTYPLVREYTLDPLTGARMLGSPRDNGARAHAGIDFIVPAGTNVLAMSGGIVLFSQKFWAGTDEVVIKHDNNMVVRYGELSKSVAVNARVNQGDVIGKIIANTLSGSSMLHTEIYDGSLGNAYPTNTGSVTYKNVPQAVYRRRADLMDPTFIMDLPRR